MTKTVGRTASTVAGLVFLGLATIAWAQRPAQEGSPPASGHRVRVLKTWEDTVKLDGRDTSRRVELSFDYTDGVARQVVYDEKGQLVSSTDMTNGPPRPSAKEFEEAVALVRADRLLGRVMARTKAVPDGGFLLEEAEGRACGPRTRCLHVLWLSSDRVGLVRWVVVDLVKQEIVYRSYAPPEGAVIMEGVNK